MKNIIRVTAMALLVSAPLWGARAKNLIRADALDAQAAGYEKSAITLKNSPVVKNLTAPNIAAHYAAMAKRMRQEAAVLRSKS